MKSARTVLATAVAFLATSALAEGLAGTWTLTRQTDDGPVETELTVVEADGKHSGTIAGPRGTMEVESIAVDGDSFAFTVTVEGRFFDMDLDYSGTVAGDAMSGKVEMAMGSAEFTGVRKK